MDTNNSYNPVITLKKFGIAYLTAFVGIIIPFSISFVQDYEWPAETLIYIPFIIAGLIAIENAWKHRNK